MAASTTTYSYRRPCCLWRPKRAAQHAKKCVLFTECALTDDDSWTRSRAGGGPCSRSNVKPSSHTYHGRCRMPTQQRPASRRWRTKPCPLIAALLLRLLLCSCSYSYSYACAHVGAASTWPPWRSPTGTYHQRLSKGVMLKEIRSASARRVTISSLSTSLPVPSSRHAFSALLDRVCIHMYCNVSL